MKYSRIQEILLFFIVIFLNSSCQKDEDYSYPKDHTVIVYMLANNDLYSNALSDINEMESGWNNNFNGNLIVIIEPKNDEGKIQVLKITHDNDLKSINSSIIKTYKGKSGINPLDMNYMISDVVQNYPSKKYSLVLWSHATGWLPSNTILSINKRAIVSTKSKSFGESNDIQMDIHELASGIPNNLFDIIIFDACFMGSIEALYEIKDKSNYIIASPSEILSDGFPYGKTIPLLFGKETNVSEIGNAFFNYYDNQTGPYRSATIGIIKTSELTELAIKTKLLMSDINDVDDLANKLANIQFYDRFKNKVFYDFAQVIECFYEKTDDKLYSFQNQLNETVIYKEHTPQFMDAFEIKDCSGLSCYLPDKDHASNIIDYYKNLKWYDESGFDVLFSKIESANK
jgi:hypothetical protein